MLVFSAKDHTGKGGEGPVTKEAREQDRPFSSLKRLLGLERLDEGTLERMCADNMRLAEFTTPLVAAGALIVFAVGMTVISPERVMFGQPWLFGFFCALMLANCLQLFVGARRYETGRVKARRAAYRHLGAFIIIGYVYAIALAATCFDEFGRMSVFYIFLILSGVLFVYNTILQTLTTAAAVASFVAVFHALGFDDAMLVTSCLSVALVVVVAGALRYDEQCRNALANVASDRASKTDVLTGLENRLAFDTYYPRLEGHALIVAMTDIDDFKYFNDAYSHETGDEVLVKFAAVLKESFPRARVYRYGGDEFVVVAVDTRNEIEFRREANEFLHRTEAIRLEGNDREKITASLGYGIGKPRDRAALGALLHLADRKLYEAKRSGKSRFIGTILEKNDISRESAMPGELPLRRSYETDQLTGLSNMQFFRAHGVQFAAHLAAAGHEPMLVYFNLANFKLVNERQGYRAGDELLCETADAIQSAFPNMLLSLIAEDHFALICPRAGLAEGIRAAQQLVDVHKNEPAVSLKAGACPIAEGTDDIGGPYDSAKIACDSIKGSFGQDLRLYDEELDARVQRRRYVLENIHAALRRDDIVVWYQPVYRAMTGMLCSCEALVRWKDERYGTIPPGDFIGLLEDTQQISELDGHVMARVCDDWKRLHDAGEPTMPVSVNFSRVDFQLVDVASIVEGNVRRVGMPRQMVHIEVTESAFTDADGALSEQIARLRELGYEVWMDDFGSGYSSLNQLKWHDFDLVKIDMAFLRNFEDEQTRTLITSIVDMLKRMGVQTLVEGVETEEQFEFMRETGCEFVQGYYLSRPIDFEQFRALVASESTVLEPFAMRGYYNAVSQVNLLSQTPFTFKGDHVTLEEQSHGSMALAVVEREGDGVDYLMKSPAFAALLEKLGVDERFTDPERTVDLEQTATARHYAEFLETVVKSAGAVSSDFIIRGHDCVVRGRKIASFGGTTAVLVALEDRTGNSGYSFQDQVQIALTYVNSLFDRVDLIDVRAGRARNVYDRSGQDLRPYAADQPLAEVTKRRAEAIVYPDDRERYLQLFDLGTLEARLQASTYGYLGRLVRVLEKDGTYRWKLLLLVPAQTQAGDFVVVCRGAASASLVDELVGEDDRIVDDLLWDTFMQLLPERLYWKDAGRRYLGANRAFLDYFGIDSTKDILGKTDEELGWVIGTGARDGDAGKAPSGDGVVGVEGLQPIVRRLSTCIARGETRLVETAEMKLVRDGRVHGFAGYFVETEPDLREARNGERENAHGRGAGGVLGEMQGRLGFEDTLGRFEDARETGGPDYGVVYLDIDNLRDVNAEMGRLFGDRVLDEVASTLVGALGAGKAIGRVRGDEFAVAIQLPQEDADERERALDGLSETACRAIAGIESVDATPCHVTASAGRALRSEAENAPDTIGLAERRMRDERALRESGADTGAQGALEMTRSDAIRRMRVLEDHFDEVRLVDPSTCEIFELDESGQTLRKSPRRCYEFWEQRTRCPNCVSARALSDGLVHEKYERLGSSLMLSSARRIEIGGRPFALETDERLPLENCAESEESREKISRALAGAANGIYYDTEVRTYSKPYLDEMLAHLRGRQVALVEAQLDGRNGGDAGFERELARAIKAHVRPGDTIVHLEPGRFAVLFDAGDPEEHLEDVLAEVRAQILETAGASACIGAIQREGTVEELVQEARLALFRAREGGEKDKVIVAGSLDGRAG